MTRQPHRFAGPSGRVRSRPWLACGLAAWSMMAIAALAQSSPPITPVAPGFPNNRPSRLPGLITQPAAPAVPPRPGPVPNPPPPDDPMMALMLSQPKLDVSGPVTPVVVVDPPVVRPGAVATLRINLNALEESVVWPEKLPVPDGVKAQAMGHGQILQMTETNMQPRSSFNYRLKAAQLGRFIIPEFNVLVDGRPVRIPSSALEVHPNPPAGIPPGQMLVLELASTNLHVGQPTTVRVRLPGAPGGFVQGLTQVGVIGDGFIVDLTQARQRIETVPQGGVPVASYVYETMLTPIRSGELSAFGQGYTVGNRFTGTIIITGPATIPGGAPQYTLLDSDAVRFNVKPLPPERRLPGFTGAVGRFTLDPPWVGTNGLRVGEPATVTVRIRGGEGLSRLVPPPPPRVPHWQVFAATPDPAPPQLIQAQGFTTIKYGMIPLEEGNQTTPAIPFSCFDPISGTYLDLTVPGIKVEVAPGRVPVDLQALALAGAQAESGREAPLVLSPPAGRPGRTVASLAPLQRQPWFPLLQAAPAFFFAGLWGWHRRRLYLEQHPGIILRARARRALRRRRRAMARAARREDKAAYLVAAVDAFRVACAPHYPAEPRALVSADILAALPEADRQGPAGQAVRQVFATADALQFGVGEARPEAAPELRTEIDRALDRLDARLRPGQVFSP